MNMHRKNKHNSRQVIFLVKLLIAALVIIGASSFQPGSVFASRKISHFTISNHQTFSSVTKSSPLASSSSDDEEKEKGENDYELEETLLRIHLSVKPDVATNDAIERVSKYVRSFPFSAVLPVQPLQYLPTQDGGVDVRFLRKKTKEKGSLDGGIRFFVREEREGIEIVAKRNSEGQTVPKMFSEKLIVLSFVQGINGKDTEKTGTPPLDVVSMESTFHKWL